MEDTGEARSVWDAFNPKMPKQPQTWRSLLSQLWHHPLLLLEAGDEIERLQVASNVDPVFRH